MDKDKLNELREHYDNTDVSAELEEAEWNDRTIPTETDERTSLVEDRERQRIIAAKALDDMAADAQRLGMYEVDQSEVRDALK